MYDSNFNKIETFGCINYINDRRTVPVHSVRKQSTLLNKRQSVSELRVSRPTAAQQVKPTPQSRVLVPIFRKQ